LEDDQSVSSSLLSPTESLDDQTSQAVSFQSQTLFQFVVSDAFINEFFDYLVCIAMIWVALTTTASTTIEYSIAGAVVFIHASVYFFTPALSSWSVGSSEMLKRTLRVIDLVMYLSLAIASFIVGNIGPGIVVASAAFLQLVYTFSLFFRKHRKDVDSNL